MIWVNQRTLEAIHTVWENVRPTTYRTRAVITRGLYTFYQLFQVHLGTVTLCMVSIQERFLIKSGL